MAVAPTGNIFKSLEFDGESSKGYGVYITGAAVYNAPEREVEMITIPGRNGSFALDHGRFQNIEVTYPAGIFADNELDFAQAVSDFRNFLCSKKGYCRLTDDYNPDEYRMAIYKSGLEVTPATLTAGQFNITFDCKPQRFLMSGESAVSLASGDRIFNPTLFESSPMLEVTGYGSITINGTEEITIANDQLGEILLKEGSHKTSTVDETFTFDGTLLNSGDAIGGLTGRIQGMYYRGTSQVLDFTASQTGDAGTVTARNSSWRLNGRTYYGCTFGFNVSTQPFLYGTSRTDTTVLSVTVPTSGGDLSVTITGSVQYGNNSIRMRLIVSSSALTRSSAYVDRYDLYANSSQSILGNPTYIDCDYGEAYKYQNGNYVSLNKYIDLGSELPTLTSGANTITHTVTALKVIPRWWKI